MVNLIRIGYVLTPYQIFVTILAILFIALGILGTQSKYLGQRDISMLD